MGHGIAFPHWQAHAPSRLPKATRAHAQARQAAFGLSDTLPHASAAHPLAIPRALYLGPAVFLLTVELVQAGSAWLILSVLAGSLFLAAAALRLAGALLAPRHSPRQTLRDEALPSMTVIVALHKEAGVVAGLLQKLARLDYPRDRLDVALAIEGDDWDTLRHAHAAMKTVEANLPVRVMAVPPIGPRTKPKALNFALQRTSGALVAVYDAEDAPAPGQLRAAAEAFAADSRLGCVQAPLGWYNRGENWLTRLFALEYAAQFHIVLPLFLRLGLPLPLGGTSNVFLGLMYQTHQVKR
ncbi:MAG: glycosyltransferase [Caulobacterales bacterium]|uniref:glycosyltransferase n=1 Tax=Glycocaulis sp. TaxID=1969725 RepID=UPI003F9ED9C2